MSSPSLPPLPDDLARLFARANEADEPEAVLAHVRSGVERAMILRGVPGFGPEDPGGGDPGGGGGASGGGGATGGGAATGGAAGASAAGALAGAVTKAAAAKVAALAATVGVVVGLAAGREWGARTALDVATRPAATLPAPPAPGSSALVAPAPPSSDESVSVDALPTVAPSAGAAARGPVLASSSPSAGSAPEGAGRSALRQERELVDGAAGALKSGNAQQALTLGAQHERRFPAGQLAEEREVIVIEALIALGRHPEASARTARFRKTFPDSPAGPRLAERIQRGGP